MPHATAENVIDAVSRQADFEVVAEPFDVGGFGRCRFRVSLVQGKKSTTRKVSCCGSVGGAVSFLKNAASNLAALLPNRKLADHIVSAGECGATLLPFRQWQPKSRRAS